VKPVLDHLTNAQIRIVGQLARKAGRLANQQRKLGYHCSESVFAAVVEVLSLKVYPPAPKMASGFHGGGGRIRVGDEEVPTGCMCGALAGGVLALGVLYGRTSPKGNRYGCIPHTAGYLHQRFLAEVGGKCCSMLRPLYQRMDPEHSCQELYRKGAELAIEAMFAAPGVFGECKLPRSLQRLISAPPTKPRGEKSGTTRALATK